MNVFKYNIFSLLLLGSFLTFSSCQKDQNVFYQLTDVAIQQEGNNKGVEKTPFEFISIAYTDIYGEDISYAILEEINVPYVALGDKATIEDMIIKNFLNDPSAKIPTSNDMRANVTTFVLEAYLKFYNREPNEFEAWYLENYINQNSSLEPETIYYSMLTSNEYRYY